MATSVQSTSGDNTNQNMASTLSSLDFSSIIGGPMVAVINAQAQAAGVTSKFIQDVGLEKPKGQDGAGESSGKSYKVRTVNFTYQRDIYNPTLGQVVPETKSLQVPLLSMLPIPFIRVSDLTIDFNVKLTAVRKQSEVKTFANTDTFSENSWWSPVSFSGSITDKNVKTGSAVSDSTFSLKVHVEAVQDQMPGGLAKILSLFEEVIESQTQDTKKLGSDASKAPVK